MCKKQKQADMFDINGDNKLASECVEQREAIIQKHAKDSKAFFYVSLSGGKL